MSSIEDRWDRFSYEESEPTGILKLPNSIVEYICRFLHSRKDKYEMCLVHKKIQTAAQTILWESPRFDRPDQLHRFMTTINNLNRVALLVKDIQLIMLDRDEDEMFKAIVKSNQTRHSHNIPLKNLNILKSIIKVCEKIETVTIYGWELKSQHIEELAASAKNLHSLHVVGANQNLNRTQNIFHPIALISILPRLTTLRLDGAFGLTESWANTLVNKAIHLKHLQLSLKNMGKSVLDIICSRHLKLTELTLTEARPLENGHVSSILQSFTKLRKLVLEGSVKLDAYTIGLALVSCPALVDLEIRSQLPSPSYNIPTEGEVSSELTALLQKQTRPTKIAKVTRLVLENLPINDDQLLQLIPFLTDLNTLGIKGCNLISDTSLIETFSQSKNFLHHIAFSTCPNLTSGILTGIANSRHCSKSLMDIAIESCGNMEVVDIYRLCCSSVQYNLRRITLIGYKSLEQTVIGSFNENTQNHGEISKIYMNKQSIDGLAHSNDNNPGEAPKDRLITGHQTILLAKHLNLTIQALEDLFKTVEEEERMMMNKKALNNTQNDIKNNQYNQCIINSKNTSSISNTMNKNINDKSRKDRFSFLKSSSAEPRPNTPSIWNKDNQLNEYLDMNEYSGNDNFNSDHAEDNQESSENEERYDSELSDERYDEDDNDEYMNENSQEDSPSNEESNEDSAEDSNEVIDYRTTDNNSPFEVYYADSNDDSLEYENSPKFNEVIENDMENPSCIDLGGWGTSNDWSTPTTNTKIQPKNSPLSFKEIQQQQQQQQQQKQQTVKSKTNTWIGFREEDLEKNWVSDPLKVNQTNKFKNVNQSHHRNSPVVLENDGWGTAENFLPWENYQIHGFARDVIDTQKKTQYWKKEDGDNWVPLNDTSNTAATTAHYHTSKEYGQKPFSLTENDFPPFESTVNSKKSTSFESLDEPKRIESQINSENHTPRPKTRFSRNRPSSVISSDNDVDWDYNDNVRFKLYDDNNCTDYSRQPPNSNSFKKRSSEVNTNSKWASPTEWRNIKQSLNDSPKKEGRISDAINYEDDGKAAKSWSTLLNNNSSIKSNRRISSKTRSSTPRHSSSANRENITRETSSFISDNTDRWKEFSNNNNVSSPSRSTTASPLKKYDLTPELKTITTPVANLIDTDNLSSAGETPEPYSMKNEVWESMNALSSSLVSAQINTIDAILQPQTQEILSWDNADDYITENAMTDKLPLFKETIVGTVTDAEIQRDKESQSRDQLVSIIDSPPSSSLLDDAYDKNNAISLYDYMNDFVNNENEKINGNTVDSINKNNNDKEILNYDHMNSIIEVDNVLKADTNNDAFEYNLSMPFKSNNYEASSPVMFNTLVNGDLSDNGNAVTTSMINEAHNHENGDFVKEESSNIVVDNKVEDPQKTRKLKPIVMKVETLAGFKPLTFYEDENVEEIVEKFCQENSMPEVNRTMILKHALERAEYRKTRSILKKAHKKR